MNKSTFDPNLRNFLTLSNNAKISYVSSQKRGCSIENILNEEPKSIWLSEDGLPQEIIIDLTSLTITPSQINCIGIYCWHAYQTNPKLIEISISQNGSKFSSLGNFDLVLKPGTQLFDIDTLSIDEVQYLKLTIKETFNGDRTYLNNVLMYEKMPSNDEINNHNSLNESSFMMYVRESRERNMPFCMKETNVSNSGNNNLKTMLNKVNNSSNSRALNVNMNLISKDLADDLLDMKSKDKFSIMNSVGNVGGGILNTNENNIITYDNVLERNYNSNSNNKINNNNINISHNERILIGNSGIIEEEDDKERSSNYNTSAKKKNVNTVIIREKEAIRYDDNDNDNEVDDDNQNINNESIHDNNNNNPIQKTLFRPNDNIIIPSTYFTNIPNNTHKQQQQQQLPIDNVDPLSKYIKSEESQDDDSTLKKQNVVINNVSQFENEFRTYQNIQDDKYKQLSNRMGRLEKNISGLKDEISKLNNNLNILMEAQNNQCNFILEECKTMINNKLLTIIGNINQMQQQQHQHHSMLNNNIPHNMNVNYNHQQLSESTKFKEEIDEHDLLDTRHRDNTSMNEMGLSGKESELEKMNEIFESKFEEKLANFSNQLGKKISDSLLKPSFEKLENLMKGNLNEVKNSLKMVEKKAKGSYRNTNYYNSNNNAYGSSSSNHNYKGKSLREKDDNSITGINEDDGYNYSGSKHGKYKKKQK